MARFKTGPKLLGAAVLIGGAVFGGQWYLKNHGEAKLKSVDMNKVETGELQEFKEAEVDPATAGSAAATMASTQPATGLKGVPFTMHVIPWMAQHGGLHAIGGPATTKGSIFERYGLNAKIVRQDDYVKQQESLIACATKLSGGAKTCGADATFVTIMGDAAAGYMDGLNAQLGKIGPQYKAEIIGSMGRSYGEDSYLAPQSVKDDPQNARGSLIAGVLKDGDWNIAMLFAKLNGICNNPDPTTYDAACLNWVGTSMFTEANEKFIQGYCEDRKVVKDGKKTGETKNVCVSAVVTWFPGDIAVVEKKGGVVPILTTRDNDSQMPNAIIGIKKWNADNRETVENLLAALLEGGEEVKRGGKAVLDHAGAVAAKVYGEGDAKFWTKYYKAKEVEDPQGMSVMVGGSRVFNLADNLRLFGLDEGGYNYFASTYETFGNIVKANYQNDLPSFPPPSEVFNTSYLQAVAARGTVASSKAEVAVFDEESAKEGATIGKANWQINFQTGSAEFSPAAAKPLDELVSILTTTGNAFVEINGHTDDVGNPTFNLGLSQSRAGAVADYLRKKAPGAFPEGRVRVNGFGQSKPLVVNKDASSRAQNRRVEIVLRSNEG